MSNEGNESFDLQAYLAIRRAGWPYEKCYQLIQFKENGFVAKIDDVIAGFAWADDVTDNKDRCDKDYREVRMKMNLKSEFAEYGIGTELLSMLMKHLQDSGYDRIYYMVKMEHYAYQIYKNLGFEILSRDDEKIEFLWKR